MLTLQKLFFIRNCQRIRSIHQVSIDMTNLQKIRSSFTSDETNDLVVPIFKKSLLFAKNIAIKDAEKNYSYLQLYVSAKNLSTQISNICGSASNRSVGYLCTNTPLETVIQWASWMSGQSIVPLTSLNSNEAIHNIITNAKINLVLASEEYRITAKSIMGGCNEVAVVVLNPTFIQSPTHVEAQMNKLFVSFGDAILIEGLLSNEFYTEANAVLWPIVSQGQEVSFKCISHKCLSQQIKLSDDQNPYHHSDEALIFMPSNTYWYTQLLVYLCLFNAGSTIVCNGTHNLHHLWNAILNVDKKSDNRNNILISVSDTYTEVIKQYRQHFENNEHMVNFIREFCLSDFRMMISCHGALPKDVQAKLKDIMGHIIIQKHESL